jgi:hypothetical protein
LRARIFDQFVGCQSASQRDRLGTEVFGHAQPGDAPVAVGLGQGDQVGGLEVHHDPGRTQGGGQTFAGAHQVLAVAARPERDHDSFAGEPGAADRLGDTPAFHRGIDTLGRLAQGQFAQGDRVALLEKVLERDPGALGYVDLALARALEQVVGRQVYQLDLVRRLEHRVRHRLLLAGAGDAGDDVVQALEVLDIHRGIDVDAGIAKLLDDFSIAGNGLAGLDKHDVTSAQPAGGHDDAGCVPPRALELGRRGVSLCAAQARRLGLAAAFGERLGEVGEQHREPQPHRDGSVEAAALGDGQCAGQQRAEPDDEHDRVFPQRRRRQALERIDRRLLQQARIEMNGFLVRHGAAPIMIRCSTMGARASAGTKVSAPTSSTVSISSPTNSGVCVGRLPDEGGTIFLAASEPAIASTGTTSQKRDSHIAMPSAVL